MFRDPCQCLLSVPDSLPSRRSLALDSARVFLVAREPTHTCRPSLARVFERSDQTGADYLIDEYVTPIMTGESITALAVTEPDGGSDVAHLLTRADVADDDPGALVVNGSKNVHHVNSQSGLHHRRRRHWWPGCVRCFIGSSPNRLAGISSHARVGEDGLALQRHRRTGLHGRADTLQEPAGP